MNQNAEFKCNSLEVKHNNQIVFTSSGKWLYPLFELGDYIEANELPAAELCLTDKIAGKAAAFMIVRLGIKTIHIKLISKGALAVFIRFGLKVTYGELVEAIQCKTEQLVQETDNIEQVWQMLRRRAGRVSGVALCINGVGVTLDNKQILNESNLKLNRGDHVIIKGPNGSGKTTLLKSILGLIPISKGQIEIDNKLVGSKQWNENRNIAGYVSQQFDKSKFPITASEVVEIGIASQSYRAAERRHRVEIAMRRTDCFHLANKLFHALSGGEQQRVAIARCICQQARLLLLDEPTSFLDQDSKTGLKQLLLELWHNEAPTIIIVSHDDQWLDNFNWPVYEIKNGKLCLSS